MNLRICLHFVNINNSQWLRNFLKLCIARGYVAGGYAAGGYAAGSFTVGGYAAEGYVAGGYAV
jgi:hypothetical protein